jgi:hypothetical protein
VQIRTVAHAPHTNLDSNSHEVGELRNPMTQPRMGTEKKESTVTGPVREKGVSMEKVEKV